LNFRDGFRCFADGVTLLRSSHAGFLVALPGLVSLIIVGGGITFVMGQSGTLQGWLAGLLPDWLDFLGTVLAFLLNLIVGIVGLWLFGFIAMVLSSPLHGILSARFDTTLGNRGALIELRIGAAITSAVIREWRKLRYQLPRMIAVAVLSFVPLINVIAPVAGILMTAWLMAIQFADLPGENRDRPFDETIAELRANRGAALGFGLGIALLLSIPIVNFLVIPVAIAGGTLLRHRLRAPHHP
jgi:CysZ protein